MRIGWVCTISWLLVSGVASGAELDEALATIKSVKREGEGNERAAAAWKTIVKQGAAAVPSVLAAYSGADETAANWLRSAIDAIVDSENQAGRKLSTEMLEAFVKNTSQDSRARSLAFDVLAQTDSTVKKRLLPEMVNDPGAGMRREAVAFVMETNEAIEGQTEDARRGFYRKLFESARDLDQVEAIAKKLKDLGVADVDVVGHLGLISRWQVSGPYDNSKLKGFAAPLPKVEKWIDHATGHPRASVDLYQVLGKAKGVKDGKKDAVYAICGTVIESPAEQPAEIRMATENAIKIFLNGQEVFAREEYHHNRKMDQHVARVTLKKGLNDLLIKVCQDDATMEWTVDWSFQCRVCDAIGGAVPLKVMTAPNAVPVQPAAVKEKQ